MRNPTLNYTCHIDDLVGRAVLDQRGRIGRIIAIKSGPYPIQVEFEYGRSIYNYTNDGYYSAEEQYESEYIHIRFIDEQAPNSDVVVVDSKSDNPFDNLMNKIVEKATKAKIAAQQQKDIFACLDQAIEQNKTTTTYDNAYPIGPDILDKLEQARFNWTNNDSGCAASMRKTPLSIVITWSHIQG